VNQYELWQKNKKGREQIYDNFEVENLNYGPISIESASRVSLMKHWRYLIF
jgi:hypothetical protein